MWRERERETERETERERETDRQTDRQTDKQTDTGTGEEILFNVYIDVLNIKDALHQRFLFSYL